MGCSSSKERGLKKVTNLRQELEHLKIERDIKESEVHNQRSKITQMMASGYSEVALVAEAKELRALEDQLLMRGNMYERKQLIINQTIASQDMKEIIQTTAEGQELANFARATEADYRERLVKDRLNVEAFGKAQKSFMMNMNNDPVGTAEARNKLNEIRGVKENYPPYK